MKVRFGEERSKVKEVGDLVSEEIWMGKYRWEWRLGWMKKVRGEYEVWGDRVLKGLIDLKEGGIIECSGGKG